MKCIVDEICIVLFISVLQTNITTFARAEHSDLCRVESEGPALEVLSVHPPLWHGGNHIRYGYADESPEVLRQTYGNNENDHTSLSVSTPPWSCITNRIIYLVLNCSNGYQNKDLESDMINGQIGRNNYTLLNSLQIFNCKMSNVYQISFTGLKQLTFLRLDNVGLTSIETNAFGELTNIVEIVLQHNNLKTISYDLFCHNGKLKFMQLAWDNISRLQIGKITNGSCQHTVIEYLALNGNNLGDLTEPTFQQYSINGTLNLTQCSITSISKQAFVGLNSLQVLSLSHNNLTSIPPGVFAAARNSLQMLELDNNNFATLNLKPFENMTMLRDMRIDNNHIRELIGSFSTCPSLMRLVLSHNDLNEIPDELFQNSHVLKILDLSFNYIREFRHNTFETNCGIESLDVSGNCITHLDKTTFRTLRKLKEFRSSSNRLTSIFDFDIFYEKSLEYVDISLNKISEIDLNQRTRNAKCNNFSHFRHLSASNNIISRVHVLCFKHIAYLDLSNNKITDLRGLRGMFRLRDLYLRGNAIYKLSEGIIGQHSNQLEVLDLGQNKIEHVSESTFSFCKNLRALYLDGNGIQMFEPFKFLNSLISLKLSQNPLSCRCEIEPFTSWLETFKGLETDYITCTDTCNIYNLTTLQTKPCEIHDIHVDLLVILLPTLLSTFGLCCFGVFVYWHRFKIQIISFYKWNIRFPNCYGKIVRRRSFKYHAFLCFAEEDLYFVTSEMIPLLEPRFRTCIHHRDFEVGGDIAETILEVIRDSAVTIIFLSPAFLDSRWGRFEFKHAHFNAMQSSGQKLVIVVIDESVFKMNLDLTLRSIIYAKSYLKRNDQLFREKLLHVIPEVSIDSDTVCQHTGSLPV